MTGWYDRLWLEVELMRRRIFIAKAERVDTTQLELEFKDKLAALDKVAGTLGLGSASDATDGKNGGSRPKPKGRRDLRQIKMPEERVEISDPAVEALVAQGQAERFRFEESAKIGRQRGGPRRLILARVKYRVPAANNPSPETTQIATAPVPPEIFPRAIASVSLVAHVLVDKYCDGLPFHRQEHRFARLGLPLDRGTMCRWAEHAGATLSAPMVAAMHADAMRTAFCISTDATGVLVQPARDPQRRRQPCRRGHYFVQIGDRDHVFFEYTPRETSAAVGEMFKGFSGYVQADAKSVHDILFRPPPEDPPDDSGDADRAERTEVSCLSHARRRYWEATIAKSAVAREDWRGSVASSPSNASGRATRPPNARRCARRTRDRTSKPSSPGPRSNSRSSRTSAVSCAPRSGTPSGTRPLSCATSTTAVSNLQTMDPSAP